MRQAARDLACGLVLCVGAGCATQAKVEATLPAALQPSSEVSRLDPVAPHTVALLDPDPKVGQFCTSVLLAPRILLSTASCFDDKDRIAYALFERSKEESDGERFVSVKVTKVAIHAQYQREKLEQYLSQLGSKNLDRLANPGPPFYDLALAMLEEAAPDFALPVSFVGLNADLKQSSLVQVGYGCQQPVCDEEDLHLHKTPSQWQQSFNDASVAVFRTHGHHGSCRGDTGSPQFQVGAEAVRLVAIESKAPQLCELGVQLTTLVAPFQVWIEQAREGLEQEGKKSGLYRIVPLGE